MHGTQKLGSISKLCQAPAPAQLVGLASLNFTKSSQPHPGKFISDQVMVLFVTQPVAKISIRQDFQISKSQSVSEIWVQFFASELNSWKGQTSIEQPGV